MKIAFFNWRDITHPLSGGAEVYSHHVLKRIAAKGHRVTILTSSYPGSKEREVIDGIEHIRYGGRYSMYPKAYSCYKKHVEGRFDVIVESINGVPFFTGLFAREPVVPFIHQLTRQNWYSGVPLPLAFLGYHLEDHILRAYRKLPSIVPSESTKSDLEALGFTDVSIVREALDFRPPKTGKGKEKSLLYLGRLAKSKRVDHAITALCEIRRTVPGAVLWIAGSGSEEKPLRALAKKLGVFESVKFFGRVDEETKAELLSKAHLVLFPATREGWGLVVIEANACGTPVIGYDVEGLRDSIKDGVNGRLVRSGDAAAMAEAAASLLRSPGELKKLSDSSVKYASKFSLDDSAREFLAVLERCRHG
ncbi:MAG TPA: glycosyltransferase family 4 protein [Candidatus Bilamarchaeum sp.]|nr:glycosyltransferase family 4 protein [Candidatus Bilamarchaeum sp.]